MPLGFCILKPNLIYGMEKWRRGGLTTWFRHDFKHFYIEKPL